MIEVQVRWRARCRCRPRASPASRQRVVEMLARDRRRRCHALRVHLVADAGVDDHRSARRGRASGRIASGSGCDRRPGRASPTAASARRRTSRRRRDGSSRRAASISSRSPSANRVRSTLPDPRGVACFSSTSTPCALDGWMNATSEPCAPAAASRRSAARPRFQLRERRAMSSTRSVMWCSPGPRFARNFAIGESVGGRLEQLDRGLAHRNEVRPHPLRRDLLGRLDLEPERVAVERQRLVEVGDGDADVIESSLSSTCRSAADRRAQRPCSMIVVDRRVRIESRGAAMRSSIVVELARREHRVARRAAGIAAPAARAAATRRARGGASPCDGRRVRAEPLDRVQQLRRHPCRWSPRS